MAIQTKERRQVDFPSHDRPTTEISVMLMMGIGLSFTIVLFLVLYSTPISDKNFLRDLFMGAEMKQGEIVAKFLTERVIFQGTITMVWAFSLATVILKSLRNKKERAAIEENVIPEGLLMTDNDKCIEVYERIKAIPHLTESLALTRVARVLAMWINTGDFERTAQYAHVQSDVDAVASPRAVSVVRLVRC